MIQLNSLGHRLRGYDPNHRLRKRLEGKIKAFFDLSHLGMGEHYYIKTDSGNILLQYSQKLESWGVSFSIFREPVQIKFDIFVESLLQQKVGRKREKKTSNHFLRIDQIPHMREGISKSYLAKEIQVPNFLRAWIGPNRNSINCYRILEGLWIEWNDWKFCSLLPWGDVRIQEKSPRKGPPISWQYYSLVGWKEVPNDMCTGVDYPCTFRFCGYQLPGPFLKLENEVWWRGGTVSLEGSPSKEIPRIRNGQEWYRLERIPGKVIGDAKAYEDIE